MNPRVETRVFPEHLSAINAQALAAFDVILDCTDNAPTRYLLSDTAVRLGKPLVSGAAQKLEGQLCVYNLGPSGPCYRCLFPRPPPREAAASCAETGILGVVTGIVGNMQALETIKLLTGLDGLCDVTSTAQQALITRRQASLPAHVLGAGKPPVSFHQAAIALTKLSGLRAEWIQSVRNQRNRLRRILRRPCARLGEGRPGPRSIGDSDNGQGNGGVMSH